MIEKVFLVVLIKFLTISFVQSKTEDENVVHYTNSWAVQLSKNNNGVLEKLRMYEGFEIIRQKHHIPDLYLIIHRRHPRKGKYENSNLTKILFNYEGILWAEQIFLMPSPMQLAASSYKGLLNDPYFGGQWYLQDCRKERFHTLIDLNVIPVWNHYKIFGFNIKVVVIDGGLEINHPDLNNNFDPEYGYDFLDNVSLPTPKGHDAHGTIVAGVIAMQANNNVCGVGIAPLVTLGAVRILLKYGKVSRFKVASALSFRAHDLDISNNSWSDTGDGTRIRHMNHLIMAALKDGIVKGRRSKGIIFIFASGNTKKLGHTCAHDANASSIYTIVVGGVKHNGDTLHYSVRCSSVLVAAYSGDGNSILSKNIVTTDERGSCAFDLNGTSVAAPMVSGIVALILEARYDLSWREVQHVLVWTSQVAALAHNKVWFRNKASFYFSLDFGFGLVDAFLAVTFAKSMTSIPPMNSCVLSIGKRSSSADTDEAVFNRKKVLQIKVSVDGCKTLPSEVNYIEHVQLIVSVDHPRRGAIQIQLISPSGTQSLLMDKRRLDKSKFGLNAWVLDTVHFWGESPQGLWSIIFYDTISKFTNEGSVSKAVLIIHGTNDKPAHYASTRSYYKFT